MDLLKNGSLNDKICWIFRLYDVNRDGMVCISDIEDITSAVFHIMTEKDDILVKTQISDRVKLITDKFGLRTREDRISLEDWKFICYHDEEFRKTLTNWL